MSRLTAADLAALREMIEDVVARAIRAAATPAPNPITFEDPAPERRGA